MLGFTSLNPANDINVNLLATAVVLTFYSVLANLLSVYKNWPLNVLETFFVINMLVLSTSMLYVHDLTEGINDTLIIVSTGSIFVVTVAIGTYHLFILFKNMCKSDEYATVQTSAAPNVVSEASPLLSNSVRYRESLIASRRL